MKASGAGVGKGVIRGGRIDGDGLVTEIYNLVWSKSLAPGGGGDGGMRIPETVVIEQGFPRVWYSWSMDVQEMERKLGKEIVLSKLYAQWEKGTRSRQEVVAEFLTQRTDPANGEVVLTVEYFDSDGLLKFLQTRAHALSGLLQKFVHPKPNCNVVVQATWSPHAMLCTARRNNYPLSHTFVSPADRCCTFDGDPSLSTSAPVSPFVKEKIGTELASFARHAEEAQRAQITGLVCFLKFDVEGYLHLLQCTSIRTARENGAPPAAPLNLGVRYDSASGRTSDILVVRCERGMTLPSIDLSNITDAALDNLRVDTSGMLYVPSAARRRSARSKPPARAASSPGNGRKSRVPQGDAAAAPVVDTLRPASTSCPFEGVAGRGGAVSGKDAGVTVDGRRVTMGAPPIARMHPEEYSVLQDFLQDVMYRAHWHFYGDHCVAAACTSSKTKVPPFEFIIPQDILALIGFEGVQVFMQSFNVLDGGHQSTKDEHDNMTQQMRLKIMEPCAYHLDTSNITRFVTDRLEAGMPQYEGGIDWARVRERQGPRRSTGWMRMVGATEAAMKNREYLKRTAGLKTVSELHGGGGTKEREPASARRSVVGLGGGGGGGGGGPGVGAGTAGGRLQACFLGPPSPRQASLATEGDCDDGDDAPEEAGPAEQLLLPKPQQHAPLPPGAPPGDAGQRPRAYLKARSGVRSAQGVGGGAAAAKEHRELRPQWKLAAAFPPAPPLVRNTVYKAPVPPAPPPQPGAPGAGAYRGHAYRTQQDQLDFWCQ